MVSLNFLLYFPKKVSFPVPRDKQCEPAVTPECYDHPEFLSAPSHEYRTRPKWLVDHNPDLDLALRRALMEDDCQYGKMRDGAMMGKEKCVPRTDRFVSRWLNLRREKDKWGFADGRGCQTTREWTTKIKKRRCC
ncbi:hypothetical protein AVEN_212196-1 [Araneus ventricosus]|uniref:Uncharacterized protein n=1 Tax=Araneus ventricosus TaxID=182803 RepID=A0A4Y2TBR5_ARAVE|nr:hypothetical protein AVEN_212196-1 [Araneus ventricosus]